MKFARDTSSIGRESQNGKPGPRSGMFRLNHNLLNNPNKLEPEQRDRTLSVMKRAQSLSSLATLVTSEKGTAFSVRLSPKRGENSSESGRDMDNESSESHVQCADITEENWFQNERNGSLDQNAFEYVQKQLFLGSELAEERAKSTEYIGTGQKPPFFGTLDTVEEEDIALELSVDPIPAQSLESMHPAEEADRLSPITPTKERLNTSYSRNSDFEFSPVRPRSNSAAPDSPSQSPRSSRRLLTGAENQTKPPAPSMLKAALINADHQQKDEDHSKSNKDKRPGAMLGASKVNDSFFNSSSEEESGPESDDDDVIPHIIPLDIPQRSHSGSVDESSFDPDTAQNTQSNAHISTQNISEDVRIDMNISPVKVDRPNSRAFTPSRLSPIHHAHSPHHSHGHSPQSPGLEASFNDLDTSVYSESAYHSAYQSSNASPHGTPPPRTKHSEEYLVGAGLMSSSHTEDSTGKPPRVGISSGSNSHRLRLMFPHASHDPNHSMGAHSPSQSRQGSYNSRSYSRQSIEDILQHALGERDTEGSAFAPNNSRFSFQSSSLSARLGECPRLCC